MSNFKILAESLKEELLAKPVCMMSGEELLSIVSSCVNNVESVPEDYQADTRKYVYGMQGLANLLGCSVPTAYRIKSSGILSDAISQYRRTIVIDAERALDLMRQAQEQEDSHADNS